MLKDIKAVVFDADDTLWSNEPLFRAAERHFFETMSDYGTLEWLNAELYKTEVANMEELGYGERTCQLAWIAGYMHDIGNVINRIDHAQSGAVMAFRILDKLGMEANEIATICSAIGNHDESTAFPVNAVAAALILADKTDVRRTRVRNRDKASFDIHDRVNYAVEKAATTLDAQKKAVVLTLTLDTEMSAVMDYFEIFLDRMLLCRKAAEKLGLSFRLVVNGQAVM